MSRNLGYTRKFIILRKEYSTMGNLNPKGHGKLEAKGLKAMISLNLENAEANNYYDVVLIGPKNNYNLGKIYVEESNKGYGEFLLGIKNLEEQGFSLERVNGVLIMRDEEVLLGGYFNKADNSIERYIESLEEVEELVEEEVEVAESRIVEEKEEVEVEVEVEVEEEEEVFEEKLDEILEEEIEVTKEEAIIQDSIEGGDGILVWEELFEPLVEDPGELIVEPTIEQVFISALEDLFNAAGSDTINKDVEEHIEPVIEEMDYDQFQNNNKIIQRNQTTGYILKILRYFPYIEPFKVNLKGYNWWKINTDDPNEEKGFLPYFSYVTGGNHKYPIIENAITANELMRKHKHYLFGLYNFKDEVKFYVYGIPGKFISEDHPQKGLTGFNTWYEDKNNEGYWLLYIDPLTGRVIYPINPMIPVN